MASRTAAPVYVVSGLPRSGTSMMMRMLAAGGLPVLADGRRPADADNPRGYFELEAVKASARDTSWVDAAAGKVVKVISYLLRHLPGDREYRVVLVRRDLGQVVRSQRTMLERRSAALEQSDAAARAALADHLVDVETWLERARHMTACAVGYERVLAEPTRQAERVARFLGLPLDVAAMARAVEPGLRRQR